MKTVLLLAYLLCYGGVFAQEEEPLGSSFARETEAGQSEDGNSEDDFLWQQSEHFRNHPADINDVSEETLSAFPFLSPLQVRHFLEYRKLLGPFVDIYELQAIPAWDIETINKIRPYVFVHNGSENEHSLLHQFKTGEHSLLFRSGRTLEKAKGYGSADSAGLYPGSPLRIMVRYKFQYKNLLQFGITAEKDPGEVLFGPKQKLGFDFYSFHFFKRGNGLLKVLAIGDYYVSLGQGLIQWQSFAFKKGSETISIKRQAPAIRPYNSTDENRFHRGAAISLSRRSVVLNVFFALDRIDANYAFDTISHLGHFTAFQTSGYHRTSGELDDKDAMRMLAAGAGVKWRLAGLDLGVNTTLYRFNLPLKKSEEPYNLYAISGKSWANYSLDFSRSFHNMHLFGELAIDKKFNSAAVVGVMMSLHPKVDLAVLYRKISSYYRTLYANAFTVNSEPNNENGVYVGLSIKPSSSWKINFYTDSYFFPWLKYRVNKPASGMDFLLQLQYKQGKNLTIESTLDYNARSLNNSISDDSVFVPVTEIPLCKFRTAVNYKLNQVIALRSRVDLVWYGVATSSQEQGFSGVLDIFYKPPFKKFAINTRLQYFETGGYNSRIYTYESDVMYYFSIPALFDAGFRYYLNFKFDVYRNLSIWAKWAQTCYNSAKSIGSGPDQINEIQKSEIRFQLSLVF